MSPVRRPDCLAGLCLAVALAWCAGCTKGNTLTSSEDNAAEAAAAQDVASRFAGYDDTLTVAKTAGYDYLDVVRRCLLRDEAAMGDLLQMTEKAPFDAASSEGHAYVLGYVLRDTGDRFFAACLAQETASVQKAVRDELLNDLGYGDTPITADEIRDLYPRTFPRPFGP
ncbi:MAG TPA: hypothetical protein PLP01_08895 [Phycisphaerae bacterium]|nr:hypothetical protein [Phycisphaerae bacterium]HOI55350.1 hypothetical protein [Phycisphaerae bacterium]